MSIRRVAAVLPGVELLLGVLATPLAAQELWGSAERVVLLSSPSGLLPLVLKELVRVVLTGVGVLVGAPLVIAGLAMVAVYLIERRPTFRPRS